MRGRCILVVVAAVAVAACASIADAECSFCRYAAWNCTVEDTIASESTAHGIAGSTKSELRKETASATAAGDHAVQVCDAAGKIQVDDVFCDSSECACVAGKKCVSLVLGCQNIFQARSRKRCIGDSAIQQRFQQCASAQSLTGETKSNLNADWVHYKDPSLCKSADCAAVRRFHHCNAVQCGRLVVAWKESSSDYRFVVDGSRASDMAAGTFLFRASSGLSDMCTTVTSTQIQDCYSPQTRNQKNGTCNGIYLQADTKLQAAGESHSLSKLSWPVWLTVVGSVCAAIASVASVIFVVVRHRRERQQEESTGLLPDDSVECKTPEVDSAELQVSPLPTAQDLRKRPTSPRSLRSK